MVDVGPVRPPVAGTAPPGAHPRVLNPPPLLAGPHLPRRLAGKLRSYPTTTWRATSFSPGDGDRTPESSMMRMQRPGRPVHDSREDGSETPRAIVQHAEGRTSLSFAQARDTYTCNEANDPLDLMPQSR